ncbi:hypothetical protein ACFFRR_000123 [Megaselia abdita]
MLLTFIFLKQKLFVVGLALVAAVCAQAPSSEYLPPLGGVAESGAVAFEDASVLADDGYRYKTVRKLKKYRHRRDVSELPSAEYLPPTAEYLPPVQESAPLADDGYRYKTVRKLKKYRHRRDVSELPSAEYLPPTAEYLPPVQESAPLADDGYRYKTVRRLRKYRH